jgi:hypothetical protein
MRIVVYTCPTNKTGADMPGLLTVVGKLLWDEVVVELVKLDVELLTAGITGSWPKMERSTAEEMT